MSAAGYAVLRFDYRGTGESVGLFTEATADGFIEDALVAVDELERRTGMKPAGIGGVRLGATIAATVASRCEQQLDLLLWEPVLSGSIYRDQLLRTAMANEMAATGQKPRNRALLKEDLEAGKTVSVDGFDLNGPLYNSLGEIDLKAQLSCDGGRVCLVQIDPVKVKPVRPALQKLVDACPAGREVVVTPTAAPPAWARIKTWNWKPPALFEPSLSWLAEGPTVETVPEAHPAPSEQTSRATADGGSECPIEFMVDGKPVRGVYHVPKDMRSDMPRIVMLPAGETCRSAVFYVTLTRALAETGWPVLRFDPRCVGDSDGEFGAPTLAEVHVMIHNGVMAPDAIAAMDHLDKVYGKGTYILSGLCGGAITDAYAGAADERVVGLVPLELRLHYTPVPKQKQSTSGNAQYLSLTQRALQSRWAFALMPVRRVYRYVKGRAKRDVPRLLSLLKRQGASSAEIEQRLIEKLGSSVNTPMLIAMGKCIMRDIPVYCLFGETEEPKHFAVVVDDLLQGRRDEFKQFVEDVIPGADHNFIMPGNTAELTRHVLRWLNAPEQPWACPTDA
jgi:alpha/beta superfamily hydrolase